MAADVLHRRAIVTKVAVRIRAATVCRGFELWCEYVAAVQQERDDEAKEAGLELAKRQMKQSAEHFISNEAADRAQVSSAPQRVDVFLGVRYTNICWKG